MKNIAGFQEACYVSEWFGIIPNNVDLLIFKKREQDIQPLTYKNYRTDNVNPIRIPKYISSKNKFTTNGMIDHVVYSIYTFAMLPRMLRKKAAIFVTPPFWAAAAIPLLRLMGRDVYIAASDPQTRLYYTYKENRNPIVYAYWLAASLAEEIAVRSASKVFVVSKYLHKSYSKKNKRVFYVPNGADTQAIMKIKPRRKSRDFTITYMGSFDAWRSVDLLVEAFKMVAKKHSKVKLLLIGGGGNIDKIREMAKGSNIEVTGWIRNHDDVIAYCKGSDLLAMTPRMSEMAQTVSSMKCFEYIACGVPLVVTDTGEHAELVRRYDTGLVAQPTAEDIAAKISKMIENKQLYSRMKAKCRKHVKDVDYTVTRRPFIEEINRA